MKIRYLVLLVILLFIVGCGPKEAPPAEEPVMPVEEPAVVPVEAVPALQSSL